MYNDIHHKRLQNLSKLRIIMYCDNIGLYTCMHIVGLMV